MRGITRDCLVEMTDRKIIYLFAIVTFIAVLIAFFSPRMDVEFHATGDFDFGGVSDYLLNPVTKALSVFLSLTVFLAVLGTAGLIPNMLVRGRADFFLSKPISRRSLLLNKILGIWSVYGMIIILCGIAVYAAAVLRHGFFDWKVLYLFAFDLISLFIWLSITATAGVVSGSGAISMMSAFLFWVAQTLLHYHEQISAFVGSKVVGYIVDALYYVVPKTGEIGDLTNAMALGKPVASWMPLYSSLVFSVALLLIATMIFRRKSY